MALLLLPLALLIWRPNRVAALLTLSAGIIAGISINWMYTTLGYVKLLGLPHISPEGRGGQFDRPDALPKFQMACASCHIVAPDESMAFDLGFGRFALVNPPMEDAEHITRVI